MPHEPSDALIDADMRRRATPGKHGSSIRAEYRKSGIVSPSQQSDIRQHETSREKLPSDDDRRGVRHTHPLPTEWLETPGAITRTQTAAPVVDPIDDSDELLTSIEAGLDDDARWLYQAIQAGIPEAVQVAFLGDKRDGAIARLAAQMDIGGGTTVEPSAAPDLPAPMPPDDGPPS